MTLRSDLDAMRVNADMSKRSRSHHFNEEGIDWRYEAAYDADAEVMVYDAAGVPRTGWVRLSGFYGPVLMLVNAPEALKPGITFLTPETTLLGIKEGDIFVPVADGPLPEPVPEPDSYFD